jgi:hypothetical protein
VVERTELPAVNKFGSHAGELETGDGVYYNIETLNGQPPLLFTEEFELVIMIEVVTEEMHGSN